MNEFIYLFEYEHHKNIGEKLSHFYSHDIKNNILNSHNWFIPHRFDKEVSKKLTFGTDKFNKSFINTPRKIPDIFK